MLNSTQIQTQIKTSQILKNARNLWTANAVSLINTGVTVVGIFRIRGICAAIRISNLHIPLRVLREKILRRINDSLALHGWVHVWLQDEMKIPAEELTHKNLYYYRLRWLETLIAEYEALGD